MALQQSYNVMSLEDGEITVESNHPDLASAEKALNDLLTADLADDNNEEDEGEGDAMGAPECAWVQHVYGYVESY